MRIYIVAVELANGFAAHCVGGMRDLHRARALHAQLAHDVKAAIFVEMAHLPVCNRELRREERNDKYDTLTLV